MVVGILIGIVGFFFTWQELSRTKETLQAGNVYEIQKDARELIDKIKDNADFRSAIKNGITPENEAVFLDELWIMLNFYLSVFRQDQIDGVSKEFVKSFSADFCRFLALASVKKGWSSLEAKGRLSDSHGVMRSEWCE